MMTRWRAARHCSILCAVLAFALQSAVADDTGGKLIYSLDFSQQPDGRAVDWLKQNGFILGLDAEKLNPRFENRQLVMSADGELAGIIGMKMDDSKQLSGVERVVIDWRVSRHPAGANWETGNNRVALAVMIFFGTERLSSGLPLGINAAPYFFSPFVAKVEPPGKMYVGKLYKAGGRYFSVAAPDSTGGMFTTDFELNQRFQEVFNKKEMPAISAVAFQMNTQDTKGGAIAAIRRIAFFGR